MTPQMHAELTADGTTIVLVPDADAAIYCLPALKTATPLFKPSKPPGAILLPVTWAAVVQLAGILGPAWRPGPRLTGWIAHALTERSPTHPRAALSVPPPAGRVPRPYQVEGALMIGTIGRVLLFDDPGCISGDAGIAINRNGKGYTLKLRDLVARFNGTGTYAGPRWNLTKPTYVQREIDGVVRLGRIVRAWSSGMKITYTVTTATGRIVRATDEHPFLTERGWLRLDQLVPGDLVHVRGLQKTTGRLIKSRYREVAGLRAHPYAHKSNAKHSPYRVAYHRLVADAHRNGLDVDTFIKQIRAGDTGGLTFLDPAVWAVHHVDFDPANNAVDNLAVMTHAEHHRLHAGEGKAAPHVLYKITTERVASVKLYGEEETFDIEVVDDPHNFLAGGFVVHNTGKTITTILGLIERSYLSAVQPVVCVVPGSVVDSWINEWRAWAPDWRVVAWRGSPASRAALAGTADVYVAGYDTARNDAADARGPLVMLNAATVIADECHFLKTPTAQRSLAVRRLARHAANFIALSGTPITHHPGDLWPVLDGLEPLAYPSRTRFVDRYCDQVRGDYETRIVGLNRFTEPEFRLSLLGQHRRVAKADVLTQLPPKIYSVRQVEIPPAWRQTYDDMEETMFAELPDGGGELSVMNVLTQLTVLSRLASSAADVEITTEIDPETDLEKRHIHLTLKAPCWKAPALVEILTERSGSPVVTFSPSRQLTMLAGVAAEKAGFSVGYVVGGQKPADRTNTIDAFQAGKFDLLAATTGVGGTGLTLTAAGTVVFTQRPWSLVEALQAEDRCHRIGSEIHDVIEVIDIVATNTVETRVREVLRNKAGQLAALLQDPRIAAQVLGGTRLGKGKR
jgi:hypothetical protein